MADAVAVVMPELYRSGVLRAATFSRMLCNVLENDAYSISGSPTIGDTMTFTLAQPDLLDTPGRPPERPPTCSTPTSTRSSTCSPTRAAGAAPASATFLETEVRPFADDHWERAESPKHLCPRIAELGLFGNAFPETAPLREQQRLPRLGRDGDLARRPVDGDVHRRALRARDDLDRRRRLRAAEGGVAAAARGRRARRRLRAHRARARLRHGQGARDDRRAPHGGPTAPTSGCSTARSAGSATAPSPTSS